MVDIVLLDWDSFRIILTIAREGSLSAAARKLDINQATVGRQLKRAEDLLDAKLFDRMSNGLFPTAAGKTAIQYAEQIEEKVNEVNYRLIGADQSLSGKIRLSIPSNFIEYGLARYVARFSKEYPDIHFEICATNDLVSFSDRNVDVVIRADNDPASGLWGFKLTTIKYVFVASTGFMAQWGTRMRADARFAPIPYMSMGTTRPDLDEEQLLSAFPNARKIADCDNPETALHLIRSGMGVGRLADFILPKYPDLVPVLESNGQTTKSLWVLTHSDFRNTKRIRLFIEYVRACYEAENVQDVVSCD